MIPTELLSQYETENAERPFTPDRQEGFVSILNCGKGDIVISFEKGNKEDAERAKKAVTDMLNAGYTIVVQTEDGYKPVSKFDARRNEYIIQSGGSKRTRKEEKRVPAEKAKATAIAPRAGG